MRLNVSSVRFVGAGGAAAMMARRPVMVFQGASLSSSEALPASIEAHRSADMISNTRQRVCRKPRLRMPMAVPLALGPSCYRRLHEDTHCHTSSNRCSQESKVVIGDVAVCSRCSCCFLFFVFYSFELCDTFHFLKSNAGGRPDHARWDPPVSAGYVLSRSLPHCSFLLF